MIGTFHPMLKNGGANPTLRGVRVSVCDFHVGNSISEKCPRRIGQAH